jgi:hypothetical protein
VRCSTSQRPSSPAGCAEGGQGAQDTPRPAGRPIAALVTKPLWWSAIDVWPMGRGQLPAADPWLDAGKDTFVPRTIDTINGSIRLFVPETRPTGLEQLIRERPNAIHRRPGSARRRPASIQALRLDGSASRPLILSTAAAATVTLTLTITPR